MTLRCLPLAALAAMLAACQPAADGTGTAAPPAIATGDATAFGAIGAAETISLIGTEPFWGGSVAGARLTYSTPENQAGEVIAVRRFAGNNGLGFSGMRQGQPLDLTITPGTCSDGMSDRSFPFTATLKLGAEQREGCAWTKARPYTETTKP